MTKRPTESMQAPEVLTLTEAAEYLRVAESELSKLADERGVPCQRIGEEWRFLKIALRGWLCAGGPEVSDWLRSGNWASEQIAVQRLIEEMKQRLSAKPSPEDPKPKVGSRERALQLAGIWENDPTIDEFLAEIYQGRGRPMIEKD